MTNDKTPGADVRALTLVEKIIGLRMTGASMHTIARTLKVSSSTVHKHFRRALADARALNTERVEELIELQDQRLDAMLFAIYPRAKAGELKAIDRVLAIEKRRAELFGLDKPTKIAPTTPDGEHPYELSGPARDAKRIERARKILAEARDRAHAVEQRSAGAQKQLTAGQVRTKA